MFENEAYVSRSQGKDPKIPSYMGGKFPLSTFLADGVRKLLAHPDDWHLLPDQVSDWLRLQHEASILPPPDGLLVETFPARRAALPRLLPLRGPPRPPDPRHAADPPARTRPGPSARLRRLGLFPRRLGPRATWAA